MSELLVKGDIGGLSTPHHLKKKVTKHRHRKCNFCPTINLIQISIIIRDGGSQSWLVISREPRLTSRLYLSLTLFFLRTLYSVTQIEKTFNAHGSEQTVVKK